MYQYSKLRRVVLLGAQCVQKQEDEQGGVDSAAWKASANPESNTHNFLKLSDADGSYVSCSQ